MVRWHDWLNGHEFEQAPGDGEGQGILACCSPRNPKESVMTEQLKMTNILECIVYKIPHWIDMLEISKIIL